MFTPGFKAIYFWSPWHSMTIWQMYSMNGMNFPSSPNPVPISHIGSTLNMDFFNHTPCDIWSAKTKHQLVNISWWLKSIYSLPSNTSRKNLLKNLLPNSIFSHFAGARNSDRIRCSESFRSAWDDSFDSALSCDAFFSRCKSSHLILVYVIKTNPLKSSAIGQRGNNQSNATYRSVQ